MSYERAARWYWKDEWGFNSVPPEEADYKLLQAILICANGDGELAETERDWVLGWGAMLNVADDKLDSLKGYDGADDLAQTVGSDPLVEEFGRRATVYYAIRACQADGSLAAGERSTIEGMASQAGLAPELVQYIFALVEAETKLKALRRVLILPAGAPF